MPFHYAEGAANYLTNTELDPICKDSRVKGGCCKNRKGWELIKCLR